MQTRVDINGQFWRRTLRYGVIFGCFAALGLILACSDTVPAHTAVTPPSQPMLLFSATARGRVDIEGGVIRLAARRDGVIAKVLVEEGEHVLAGQVLATLDDELAQRNLVLMQRETDQASKEQAKAHVEWTAAEREVRRLEPLAATGTVPQQELDRAHDALALALVARQSAQAHTATARARAAVAERELHERAVVAPLSGQIIQRQARPGNGVSTLNVTPLFLFAPDGPRIVRAELEEQYLDAVRPMQAVQVVLQAQPHRMWRAHVLRIGRVVGARTPSDDPLERQDNRVVEVVIALEQADELLIGQRVIARFQAL